MKKVTIYSLIITVSAFLFAGTIKADIDNESRPWIGYSTRYVNSYIYDGDKLTDKTIEGEIHAGEISSAIILYIGNPPEDLDPAPYMESYYGHTLVSMYKDTMMCKLDTMKFDWDLVPFDATSIVSGNEATIGRGGRYMISIGHFPGFYEYRDTFDVLDVPSLRFQSDEFKGIKDTIRLTAIVSTGYPFDMDALTGNETLKWNMKFSDNDTTFTKIAEGEKKLNLKEVDRPLIAGFDTVMIERKPEKPGVYAISTSSDFAPANRAYSYIVNDTLRATVSLDKESYAYGVDKEAKAHLTLDYGYPYVHPLNEGSLSTVAISYAIGEYKDTMFVSSDTLRYRRMNMEIDVPINLELVDESVLDADAMNAKMGIFVNFNGKSQFVKFLKIPFVDPTAVENIESEAIENRRYNIMGLPADERTKGIIIENGKKRLRK